MHAAGDRQAMRGRVRRGLPASASASRNSDESERWSVRVAASASGVDVGLVEPIEEDQFDSGAEFRVWRRVSSPE